MSQMLEIDGGHGEGGGQVLRSALALSLATGRGFRLTQIRARRAKPGLMRQHLACVLAAQQVSGARVMGAELGATTLEFEPGEVRGGEVVVEIGTAGSTVLVAQSLLPGFIAKGVAVRLVIHGGTHNPMAPPFSAFEHVVAPIVRRLGVSMTTRLLRPGFAPMGGGAIEVAVEGVEVAPPLALEARGALRAVTIEVLTVALPDLVATREVAVVKARLAKVLGAEVPIEERLLSPTKNRWRASSVGNAIAVLFHFEGHTEEVSMLGERKLSAEHVAARVADKAEAFLAHGQPVGEHLQDQLPVLLAVTRGGRYQTTAPTPHLSSQLDLLPRFTGRTIRVTPVTSTGDAVCVEIDPIEPRWGLGV